MIFKKSKYNIVFLLMFMLVIGVFGFEVFFATSPQVEITVPDGSNGEQNGDDPNGGGTEDPEDPGDEDFDDVDPNAPTDTRKPRAILTYALNKLYNGEGYSADYTKKMTNTAMGISVPQEIKGTLEKSGDKALEKFEFRASGSMASQAANYLRYFYFEGDKVTHYQTADYNYDISSASQREMSKADYLSTYCVCTPEKPILDFVSSNFSTPNISKKKNNSGKEYYIITINTANKNAIPSAYYKYYEAPKDFAGKEKPLKNVEPVKGSYTFYIYKNTAQIFRMHYEEDYTGTYPSLSMGVTVHVSVDQTITKFNTAFDIAKP